MDRRIMTWHRLQSIMDTTKSIVAKTLQSHYGLGLSEYRALQLLSEAKGDELRMQELASLLDLNQSSVSRLVERLERSGYTTRDTCPDDKRGIFTVLTHEGKQKYTEVKPEYERVLLETLNQIKSDPVNRQLIETIFSIAE